jgi:hypothetical protein
MKYQPGSKERGQTTAEYVAITAAAVGVAFTVVWLTLASSINTAIAEIGTKITDFIAGIIP